MKNVVFTEGFRLSRQKRAARPIQSMMGTLLSGGTACTAQAVETPCTLAKPYIDAGVSREEKFLSAADGLRLYPDQRGPDARPGRKDLYIPGY